jgi:uncharacterized membrane protein YphA (DoxX/SURF4 family)
VGKRLDSFDLRATRWMARTGHPIERWLLGILFLWFGTLKVAGQPSATSIIAKTVYLGDPAFTVPVLGVWEVCIGLCLIIRPLLRLAIALMLIRLPGTLIALVVKFDDCFVGSVFTPTIQGQYLMKDAALLGAALVLGSTVRVRPRTH